MFGLLQMSAKMSKHLRVCYYIVLDHSYVNNMMFIFPDLVSVLPLTIFNIQGSPKWGGGGDLGGPPTSHSPKNHERLPPPHQNKEILAKFGKIFKKILSFLVKNKLNSLFSIAGCSLQPK